MWILEATCTTFKCNVPPIYPMTQKLPAWVGPSTKEGSPAGLGCPGWTSSFTAQPLELSRSDRDNCTHSQGPRIVNYMLRLHQMTIVLLKNNLCFATGLCKDWLLTMGHHDPATWAAPPDLDAILAHLARRLVRPEALQHQAHTGVGMKKATKAEVS